MPKTDHLCSLINHRRTTVNLSNHILKSREFKDITYRVFFYTGPPPKSSKYEKVNLGSVLGVSRTIYVNVDSPDLGFPYFNFLGEAQ